MNSELSIYISEKFPCLADIYWRQVYTVGSEAHFPASYIGLCTRLHPHSGKISDKREFHMKTVVSPRIVFGSVQWGGFL